MELSIGSRGDERRDDDPPSLELARDDPSPGSGVLVAVDGCVVARERRRRWSGCTKFGRAMWSKSPWTNRGDF
jgi:hypothetical protein